MDDAALVAAARTGDREAWGLVYDRYADRLHDHCWSILRDEHEASDALHDAFVKAAAAIAQLRDPSRLRPWLYAIARNEAYRRHRARARAVPTEDLGADDAEFGTVSLDLGTDAGSPVEDLRRLVWDAAGGLSADDQALLDLHLRQGLEGEDLAEAMGITANNAYVKLSRLRDILERSLGALLVARTGSRECADLEALVAGWDGAMSPLLRKRIARHIDGCETCGDRKRRMVSPLALLAGVPLVPAPAALRDRILDDAVATAASTPVPAEPADPIGPIGPTALPAAAPGSAPPPVPPVPPARASDRNRWGWVLGAAAAAVVVVAGLLVGLAAAGDDPEELATGGSTSTTVAPTTTTSTSTSTSSTTSSTTTSTTSTTLAPAPPGVLTLTGADVQLGATASTGTFRIVNTGGSSLSYILTTSSALLRATPAAGIVAAGEATTVTVRFDRTQAAEGPFQHTVAVDAAGAGAAQATVRGTVARPPVIGAVTSSRDEIFVTNCPITDPKTTTITATFTDETTVGAELRWEPSSAGGPAPGAKPMQVVDGTATAELGPFTAGDDDLVYTVVLTDALDATATSAPQTITVTPCAQ